MAQTHIVQKTHEIEHMKSLLIYIIDFNLGGWCVVLRTKARGKGRGKYRSRGSERERERERESDEGGNREEVGVRKRVTRFFLLNIKSREPDTFGARNVVFHSFCLRK